MIKIFEYNIKNYLTYRAIKCFYVKQGNRYHRCTREKYVYVFKINKKFGVNDDVNCYENNNDLYIAMILYINVINILYR